MPRSFGWNPIKLANVQPLPDGEIHIFATQLAPEAKWKARAHEVLNRAEKERASCFRFEEDRYRFEKTRTALRLLLSNYLSAGAGEIEFREGPHGKPYLQEPQSDLQFNVSHTKGAAVLAFARGIELGIDVEHAQRKVDVEGVGRRVFTKSEQAGFRGQSDTAQLHAFFRLWTAKEAYLKATGSGLSCDPSGIEADFIAGGYHSAIDPEDCLPYGLKEIETRNRFLICLAHEVCDPPTIHASELF